MSSTNTNVSSRTANAATVTVLNRGVLQEMQLACGNLVLELHTQAESSLYNPPGNVEQLTEPEMFELCACKQFTVYALLALVV
jgi:hypothetical protein